MFIRALLLWRGRKLTTAGNIAIFNMGDTIVYQGVAKNIGNAKRVWPRPHAATFNKVIVRCARNRNPTAIAGLIF